MAIYLFLVTGFASRDNGNIKIGNLANLVPKFDNNKKLWIGFNVNSAFERVWWFEIVKMNYLNCSIIWFDLMQKMLHWNWNSVWIIE